MTIIRLDQTQFDAAPSLAELLEKRMLTVVGTEGDVVAELKSTVLVCSAEREKALGGEDATIALGRNLRAGRLMVVDDKASKFEVSESLGGKLIRVALPTSSPSIIADDYGIQLLATLLSDERTIACGDQASCDLFSLSQRVAKTDVTVFINGPTGTGKEVLSKFIHNHSERSKEPFVAVNCAAIPDNMLEAILFGHEKGAFTGASTSNKGIFRAADGGTLLLDEISEMPISLQAKLLRALQEKTVTPIGSQTSIPVDVRVIATTNRNMAKEILAGKFREDLYYRLNVFPLNTIALANRPDDIVPLATFLLQRHIRAISDTPWIDSSAIAELRSYHWPGNVRELENVLQRALVLSENSVIKASDILIDSSIEEIAGAGQSSMTDVFRQSAAHA